MTSPLKTLALYSRSTVPTTIYFSALVGGTYPLHNGIFYTMSIFFVSEEIAQTFWCLEKKCVFQKPQNFHISANLHTKLNMAYITLGYPYFMFFVDMENRDRELSLNTEIRKVLKRSWSPLKC